MSDRSNTTVNDDAVEAGIEAAAEAVSNLPIGERKWDKKEYMIAQTAARTAVNELSRRLQKPPRRTASGS